VVEVGGMFDWLASSAEWWVVTTRGCEVELSNIRQACKAGGRGAHLMPVASVGQEAGTRQAGANRVGGEQTPCG
jgi:hypothetical protein